MCRPSLAAFAKETNFLHEKSVFVRQTVGCAIFGRTKISLTFAGKTLSVQALQVSLPTLRFSADRQKGKMRICHFCKTCKNNFAVVVFVRRTV